MSKKRKKIDENQLSIFDVLMKISEERSDTRDAARMEGQFKIIDRLRASLRSAIKGCPLSVHQVAGEMSHLVGQSITAEVIYSWTRESDEINGRNTRHVPAEWLPAFCRVTQCTEPLVLLCRTMELFVLPGPEALMAEIQKLDEGIKKLQQKKRVRMLFKRKLEEAR